MITLLNIADLFIHDFSGGGIPSIDSVLDRRDVIKKARGFISAVVKPEYYAKMNEGDKSAVSQCIYSYELSLETDSEGKYVTIPDSFMVLSHNRGLHRIFVKGNYANDFVIQHHPGVSGNLPHTGMVGIQYCYIEGKKVRMAKGCSAKKADKIMLQIINPAPDALGENDAIPMGPEHLSEVLRLLKMDFAPFANITSDYLNNNNTNIR